MFVVHLIRAQIHLDLGQLQSLPWSQSMSALRGRILIINPFSARQLVTIRPVRRWLHRTIVCVNTSGALQEELLLLVLHIERLIAS